MILVDPPAWPWRGRLYCHLVSDTDLDELHALAARAGVHPRAFDGDHYDVPQEMLGAVVAAGAVPVDAHELVTRLNASGLRRRKRRGDKLLDSVPQAFAFLTPPHRFDLYRCQAVPAASSTVAAVMFVRDLAGRFLLVRHPRCGRWEAPGGWVEAGESARDAAVREVAQETGLRLNSQMVSAYGYQRIEFLGSTLPTRWHRVSHVAVFAATVPVDEVGPVRAGWRTGPEGAELTWVESDDVGALCAAAPWWPLMAAMAGVDLPPPAWATPRAP